MTMICRSLGLMYLVLESSSGLWWGREAHLGGITSTSTSGPYQQHHLKIPQIPPIPGTRIGFCTPFCALVARPLVDGLAGDEDLTA